MGAGGARCCRKKTHSSRRGEGEGSLNKLISTIGFLEAGMVSCDWLKEMEWIARRGLLLDGAAVRKGRPWLACVTPRLRGLTFSTHIHAYKHRSITPRCVWRGVIKTSGGGRWRGNGWKGGQKSKCVCVCVCVCPCCVSPADRHLPHYQQYFTAWAPLSLSQVSPSVCVCV